MDSVKAQEELTVSSQGSAHAVGDGQDQPDDRKAFEEGRSWILYGMCKRYATRKRAWDKLTSAVPLTLLHEHGDRIVADLLRLAALVVRRR